MIENLREVVSHTHGLGNLEVVKITGEESSTSFMSVAANKEVLLKSLFFEVDPDFEGVFGIGDVGRLAAILNIPEYRIDATMKINRKNGDPVSVEISNGSHDVRNEYRFMARELIDAQLPDKKRRSITWNVSIEPSPLSVQRLKSQAMAIGSGISTFHAHTKDGALHISLGEASSHTGEFIFAKDVQGALQSISEWPLHPVLSILNLPGTKTMDISEAGIMQIVVKTEIAEHQYSIFAKA